MTRAMLTPELFTAAAMLFVTVGGRVISEQDFGVAWPFTVPEGRLRCTKDSVTFEANGSTYRFSS